MGARSVFTVRWASPTRSTGEGNTSTSGARRRAVARKAFACPPVEALRTESSSVRLPTGVPPAVPWFPACAAPPNRPTLSPTYYLLQPTYYLLQYRVVRTMLQRLSTD